ncbi:hypothetical protein PULV_a1689 [Pseudoalteromonas ulvae UL12]|uniref:DUF6997 domain-containing protein n=1 Tax=Pseudoalteromonas ulvae TaxID=107327 RepID=UPI0019FCF368|nr:hypothetical protein [Pseudoalteromonas ulvae]MBE0364123.1 hypothetical protein [Pseudoalteromonas ulvae UL12]
MNLFDVTINSMLRGQFEISEPTSFKEYAKLNYTGSYSTAPSISVDSLKKLPNNLTNNNTMVLRLGNPDNKGTLFSLVKAANSIDDFFFNDHRLFASLTPELFLPNVSIRSLFAFQLLPKVTETSIVNLALASGLLAEALRIDTDKHVMIPATGQSTFTFSFKPRADIETTLDHINGQVEIDAVFVGKRDGKEHLFIVEAKHGETFDSLAKHKLFYPLLSLLPKIPKAMPVVPVYLRTIKSAEHTGIDFYIAECPAILNNHDIIQSLDTLTPFKTHALHLANY